MSFHIQAESDTKSRGAGGDEATWFLFQGVFCGLKSSGCFSFSSALTTPPAPLPQNCVLNSIPSLPALLPL